MKLPKHISWNSVSDSKNVRRILLALGVVIILLGVFKLGEISGYHRAQFTGHFGNSFDRTFNGTTGNFPFGMNGMPRESLPPGGHGAAGTIASISLPNIVVADRDGLEKTVHVTDKTDIRQFRNELTPNDLSVGQSVIVLGMPGDSGQIEAVLIRVLPAQPNGTSASTSNSQPPALPMP